MKTLLSLLLFSAFICYAQPIKGSKSLGLNIYFYSSSSNPKNNPDSYMGKTNSSEFEINPRIGFYLADNQEIGIGVDYYTEKSTQQQRFSLGLENSSILDLKSSENMFSIKPYYKWYNNIFNRIGIFTGIEFSYGIGKREYDNLNFDGISQSVIKYKYNMNQIAFSIYPGLYYHLNEKFSLEASVGGLDYVRIKSKLTEPNTRNEVSTVDETFRVLFSLDRINFGVQYYF